MAEPNITLIKDIEVSTSKFADKYPDVYLGKMQNYRGLRCSHPPLSSIILDKEFNLR